MAERRPPSPSMIITAGDITDPSAEDAREIHGRSQALLHHVLRHRGVQALSSAVPFVHSDTTDVREQGRLELTSRLRKRIRERGIHGLRTLRTMLHANDIGRDGTCSSRTLEGALAHMGIRLSAAEFSRIVPLFGTGEGDTVDYAQLLAYGCSNWSLPREEVVQEAFETLASACPGSKLHISAIERRFQPQSLTADLVPNLVEHHSAKEFLSQWGNGTLDADGILRWLDFADYYLDVSMYFDSDQDFCKFVCACWGLDMDDWVAKKVFLRFAKSSGFEAVLPASDFIHMLNELDPTISEEEALAFYQSIDCDDSGEVSLEEFLASKVLQVKRLFDEFDTQASRTATKEEMLMMLRRLNSAITDEEALAVYLYADVDGNGEVSFSEFLENNLLKLLQIFGEFCRARNRSFSEAEMKALLRREDPRLDAEHVQQIYRAIDTDSSGSISFVEFCESYVLKAKTLFDRYDVDKSRSLTKLKFRELLLDMDESLAGSQLEAIYDMVADHNSGKVHLGGFLSPNVVRIKLLFDKYDQDRSGYLDVEEFKAMLKDMFTSATDKDIDTLMDQIMPPGQESGISFTGYVQKFREISQRHEIIQLAKRRQARAKAINKGLVPQ